MTLAAKARAALGILRHRREREFYLQRLVMARDRRGATAARLAARLPQAQTRGGADEDQLVAAYVDQGYSLLPGYLEPATAARMRDHFIAHRPHDVHRPELGSFDPLAPTSSATSVAYYDDQDVLSAPGVFDLANDPRILGVVARLLGAKPLISYMAAWWTYPSQGDNLKRGEMFHRDVDDWNFVKVFTYLTDVDEEAGPHQYISFSHKADKLMVVRNFQDGEVFEAFPREDLRSFTGPAGTTLIENTFGLHRGTKPVHKPRLIYQTLYSLRETIYGPRRPIIDAAAVEHRAPLDPYINSIYLRF
jgi:hypothetical protein